MNTEDFANAYHWLADAPLFIDADNVARFHDAVIVPESQAGPTTVQVGELDMKKFAAEIEAGISGGTSIIDLLKAHFGVKLSSERSKSFSETTTVIREPIHTSQRRLIQIVEHYQIKKHNSFYVQNPSGKDWRDQALITKPPRLLVFLDLPSQEEAVNKGLPSVKLIPTAAEFENGKIVLLYNQLLAANGEHPPRYPENPETGKTLLELRKEYWQWFDLNYSSTRSMVVIEEAASNNGRIRWIDYRIPISNEGDTLHLHCVPAGQYDTGVFAYNLVKRGMKHGIRLVGTLKSEPDMNVLAIYDK